MFSLRQLHENPPPGSGPPKAREVAGRNLAEALEKLERRSFKTYLARRKSYERLSRRSNAWNASLVSLATSTTISSVGILVDNTMYGRAGDALMVTLSILSLVASLVVSSLGYGIRARSMEASYKRIQQISLMAENFYAHEAPATYERFVDLQKEYEVAIEASENHTEADYQRSQKVKSRTTRLDTMLTALPYVTLLIPIALVVPLAKWFI
jgi:hypothetical protein